jgi:hypothetical protein
MFELPIDLAIRCNGFLYLEEENHIRRLKPASQTHGELIY